MAADLSVLLELDDRDYQRGLREAETSAVRFGQRFTQALGPTAQALDSINNKLSNFSQLLIGAGIGAFIVNISKSAAELTTMSRALGVTTESFLEMSTAAQTVGVDAAGIADRLSEMTARVAEAAGGNIELRQTFSELGISISDMRNLAPDELFNKITQNLASIEDPARRAVAAGKLLGEEGRKIDWSGYTRGMDQVRGRMGDFAESQENLASITKDLSRFTNLLQLEFGKLLGPIARALGFVGDIETQFDAAAITAKTLAVAIGAIGAGVTLNALSGIVGVIRSIGASFGITASAAALSTATVQANTSASLLNANAQIFLAGAHGRLGTAVAAVAAAEAKLAALMAAGPPTQAALTAATTGLTAARSRLAVATETVMVTEGQLVAATQAQTGVTVANTTATTANTTAKSANAAANTAVATTATTAAGGLTAMTTASGGLIGRLSGLIPIATAVAGALALIYSPELNGNEDQQLQRQAEFNEKLKQLDPSQLEKYYDLINKNKNLTAQDALAMAAPDKFGPEANKGTLGSTEWKDIAAAGAARRKSIAEETQLMVQQNDRLRERAQLELSLLTESRSVREATLAQFDAETQKRQKIFDLQSKIREVEAQISADPYRAQQEGLEGVIEAYRAQIAEVERLTEGVGELRAAEIERADAIEMQNYFLERQRDGQEEIRSIVEEIEDLTRTEGERRLADAERLIQREKELAIEKRKTQLGVMNLPMAEVEAIEKQIEDAYGGIRQKTRDLLNESRSWETGWKRAMKTYVDEATNGAKRAESVFQKAFSGMEDLLVDFAKTGKFEWKGFVAMMLEELLRAQIQAVFAGMIGDMSSAMRGASGKTSSTSQGSRGAPQTTNSGTGVWDTVKSIGSSVWDTVKSIGSGVMDFFGGFFANGGTLGAGKWGIAGEAGPEIIHGPAQITPISAAGTASTYVTYNINAVDALSFKQMLARDPSFIHGLVAAGSKGIASRR